MTKTHFIIKDNISVKYALIAGFIASAVTAVFLIISTSIAVTPQLNNFANQWFVNHWVLIEIKTAFFAAWSLYFITGIFLWGWLYAISQPYLKGEPIIKGAKFGIMLWVLAMFAAIPLVVAKLITTQHGIVAASIVLLASMYFGMTIGYFYDRLKKSDKDEQRV